jgi:potassium efflux system protein
MLEKVNEFLGPVALIWNHKLFAIGGIKLSLGNLVMALTMLLFATRLSRVAARAIDRRLIKPFVDDRSSQHTYQTFAFYGCLAGFVTLSLAIAGIPLTVFTVFGGALAIGVGFGSQNIVNNFISGIILLVEKPIKVGDIVELDSISGAVLAIGTRSTQVKNAEGKIFVVPNSFFLEKSVLNWSYEDPVVRTTLAFGVAYGSDVRRVRELCFEILGKTPEVLAAPKPVVVFDDFADSSLMFQLHFWCNLDRISTLAEVRSAIRFEIDDRFKEAGIEMAFPQRDMNLKVSKALEVRVLS